MILDGISPCTAKPREGAPGHVLHDTKDDRREVYRLLARLSPARRLGWLEWACRQAVLPGSQVRPTVSRRTRELAAQARWDSAADERLTLTIYHDLWMLDVSYAVNFEALLVGLEGAQKKHPGATRNAGAR